MRRAPAAPTAELLAWVAERPRTYPETLEAWRTSCPRLSIWEDALTDGLVRVVGGRVVLTGAGAAEALRPTTLETERLRLEPLSVGAAAEMVDVLADPALYLHVGGAPPDLATLTRRYERQAGGRSDDGSQRWLNWIVRLAAGGAATGFVQATVAASTGVADLAWVVGTRFQRRGIATEAAAAVVAWLGRNGIDAVTAHVHPANSASEAVARRLGLAPTATVRDGEVCWRRGPGPDAASGPRPDPPSALERT